MGWHFSRMEDCHLEHRLSPSYRSNSSSDHRPLSSPHDHDRSTYQSSGDSHTAPLPMPKKSILKKRSDVESSGGDPSPQADKFSNSEDIRSTSSTGASKSVEKSSLNVERHQLSPPRLMGKSGSSVSAQKSARLPGSNQPTTTPGTWTPSSSTEIGVKGNLTDNTPPSELKDNSKVSPYTIENSLYSKSASVSQTPFSGMSVFPEGIPKRIDEAGGFLLPHEQDSQSSPLHSKQLSPKQRSSIEIEDEERFLYGDEEDKKPELQKTPTTQAALAPPATGSPDKQEFEKIHDLLKTIGLDIGVAEIGKLAVRTQERLHGKKATPKICQPTAERSPSTATASPTDVKAKVPEPQVKTEKKDGAGALGKTESPVKPVPKEATKPVKQPSPATATKEKPQLILRKPLLKETAAVTKIDIPVQQPTPSPVPDPTPPPMSPSQIPVYPPYPHSPMVSAYNIPPPNYNPYTPYVSYPTSSWAMFPPMPPQPPPGPMLTPPVSQMSIPVSTPAPVYNPRSNLRIIETTEDIPDAKALVKTETKPATALAALLAKQEADRKNKETEKKKVLEELDCIRKEHKVKSESLKTLTAKVEQLRVQQGILLRKKRREKDGHKDPLLEELNNVLETAHKQMKSLREEISTTKLKQHQLIKVAEILGVNPSELVEKIEPRKERSPASPAPSRDSDNESRTSSDSSKSSKDLKTSSNLASKNDAKANSSPKSGADTKPLGASHQSKVTEKSEDTKCKGTPAKPSPDSKNSPEPHLSKSKDTMKTRDKSRSKSPRPCTPSSKITPKSEEPPPFDIAEVFEYYDPGSHWCEHCNAICMTLPEYLLHLHDKKHGQFVKGEKRPWLKKKVEEAVDKKKKKVNIPLKGPEFLVPVSGYYCDLCNELFPDHIAAEEHLRAYAHNDKYKKYLDSHVYYETFRREKKKAKLTAAQEASREAARKLAEQKRKRAEQKHEAHEHSKSKKPKKEEQKDSKAKTKRRTSASPTETRSSSDQKRKKTPEKEPVKSPAFGKFFWKQESKTQAAVITSKVETPQNKPKDEEPKPFSLKPKGFAMKLIGKPSTLPGNALSTSHSSPSTPATSAAQTAFPVPPVSTAFPVPPVSKAFPVPPVSTVFPVSTTPTGFPVSPAPATTTTTTATTPPSTTTQTKVQPNLSNVMTIRPNLPIVNIRSAAPLVTVSKPAPLNTFLSIRSPNSTSKSIPIMKNKPTGVFSADWVSKAFGGEVVILKESTKPDPKGKTENNDMEKAAEQSPKPSQTKGQDMINVLMDKNESVKNQEVKTEKEGSASKQLPSSVSQKSDLVPPASTSQVINISPTKPAQSQGSGTGQQTTNTKPFINFTPVSSTTSVKSSISSFTKSSNTSVKLDSNFRPIRKQPAKPHFTPKREESKVQQPQEAKPPTKSEMKPTKEVNTSSTKSSTERFEYLPVQKTKVSDTNSQKLPETKPVPTSDTEVSGVKPHPAASVPPEMNAKPTFNATTKLNQKFKKAPISLPSSLFGHVQDSGCRDIKITSIEIQKTGKEMEKFQSPAQKAVSSNLSAKPNLQNELDTYYKLIASEDDPEDLTTSEDQDSESLPANATRTPIQSKVESPLEKKAKLESALPAVKTPVKQVFPDVSSEDVDDADMACEVPDAPSGSVSQTSGWKFTQASNPSNQSQWGSNTSVNKGQSNETHATTAAASDNSMEDLSVYVTCDSD
ncbi:zinc finger protein 318 isoform X2 [Engystomops pustulosus]|uniref:zinc finger protein 318 isoform X2 n=1 Tax=Engystomops pustulosus TaxID=76066 RepID=UPI003AFB6E33